jgi:hypothetical protein
MLHSGAPLPALPVEQPHPGAAREQLPAWKRPLPGDQLQMQVIWQRKFIGLRKYSHPERGLLNQE